MFIVLRQILFGVHSKHFSFWPSADVNPMSSDQAHALPLQCMFALSMCTLWSLWQTSSTYLFRGSSLTPGTPTYEKLRQARGWVAGGQIVVGGIALFVAALATAEIFSKFRWKNLFVDFYGITMFIKMTFRETTLIIIGELWYAVEHFYC